MCLIAAIGFMQRPVIWTGKNHCGLVEIWVDEWWTGTKIKEQKKNGLPKPLSVIRRVSNCRSGSHSAADPRTLQTTPPQPPSHLLHPRRPLLRCQGVVREQADTRGHNADVADDIHESGLFVYR